MAGGDSSINGTAAQRVDWSALRSYIAGKEAFEAEHGRPAPLTDHEVSAIAILLRPAPRPEPDLGKTNWLGLLNHFQQVRNQKVTFNDEARQEQGLLGKAKELRWACSATFDSTGDVFPRPGYGIDAGEDISRGGAGPAFQGKKDAKQWAAKAACEWLIDNGHMMPSGDLPKFPKPFAPAASAALAAAAAPIPVTVSAPSPSRGVASGSVLPSKRSPPSSPPAESSAAASRKKQDMNQPPKTSPSPPAHLPSVAASKSNSSLPSHQAPPPPSANTPKAPKLTLPLNVMASPTSATHDSTTTSTASTPSLGAGAPISTTAQSQAPTPSISPAPTSAPTPAPPQASESAATTSAEKRVRDLCTQLHFPVPRYIMTPDPALEDFWDGRADFDGNPLIPDDLGTVRRILHKKAAREKMADAIVAWLEAEVEKRERTAKLVLWK
ncbi:hypothetical protein BDP81DRAFT_458655 [Colletotrichum phormii]|uniref:DRBM domain-containing protein n=1 Tax=Colletotrichum phormii TaxID=359342 RepID=A0AAJ0EL45_9PEZI|nr:uncharacterized protein BDP81DRAFT_458655 [Colletotrichum phormii]KAK1640555.1 hypothetical protein BDP81DRAFT_458655 [Colletotrichum phormii]